MVPYAFLPKVAKQFMQLHRKKLLARHRIQEAIQAVDNQQLQILLLDQFTNLIDKLPR